MFAVSYARTRNGLGREGSAHRSKVWTRASAETIPSMGKRKRGAAKAADDVLRRQEAEHPNVVAGRVIIPQKRWYRQRAHANPFSDHSLV